MKRSLPAEWAALLDADTLNLDALREIYQTRRREKAEAADGKRLFEQQTILWREERSQVEQRVRHELGSKRKTELRDRYYARNEWAADLNDQEWTVERYIVAEIQIALEQVPTVQERMRRIRASSALDQITITDE